MERHGSLPTTWLTRLEHDVLKGQAQGGARRWLTVRFRTPTPASAAAFNASVPRYAEDDPMFWDGQRLQARHATEVTPEVSVVPLSSIYDPAVEFKARRIIDQAVLE